MITADRIPARFMGGCQCGVHGGRELVDANFVFFLFFFQILWETHTWGFNHPFCSILKMAVVAVIIDLPFAVHTYHT